MRVIVAVRVHESEGLSLYGVWAGTASTFGSQLRQEGWSQAGERRLRDGRVTFRRRDAGDPYGHELLHVFMAEVEGGEEERSIAPRPERTTIITDARRYLP